MPSGAIAISGIVICALGLWFISRTGSYAGTSASVRTTASDSPATVSSSAASRVNRRVARVERRLRDLENDRKAVNSLAWQESSSSKDIEEEEEEETSAEEELLDLTNLGESLSEFDHQKVGNLASALELEPRDTGWSDLAEEELALKVQELDLEGSAVSDLECRYTFCSLRASHDSAQARMRFEQLAMEIPGMGAEFIPVGTEGGKLGTHAYFIRSGFDGLEHPVRERP